ncbi:MAG: cysteine hydrolase [Proteobacteria bacterium]|nr:cysteine hydrolase [Pseudomonadota bacterium]
MSDTALLVIDIQNDYFPGGKMELERAAAAAARARQAIDRFRKLGRPVFHVQHLSARPGATFFIPGTEGADINTLVAPAEGEAVIQKNFPNSFRGTDLQARLDRAGIKNLAVAGMMTHMCVDASVRQAFDLGYGCTVLSDACATRAQNFEGQAIPAAQVHGAFLAALRGVYAQVMPTEEFLKTL